MEADPALGQPPIKLLVGLQNPGPEYEKTRHNAGVWALRRFADAHGATLKVETKFEAEVGRVQTPAMDVRLMAPLTYMNASGRAVAAVTRFFKVAPPEVLVLHDDLDLPPGTVRLKIGGGSGGNNGLKDCIKALGTQDFMRARIGIGHPGDRGKVVDYVLSTPSRSDQAAIDDAIARLVAVMDDAIAGRAARAMNELHRG